MGKPVNKATTYHGKTSKAKQHNAPAKRNTANKQSSAPWAQRALCFQALGTQNCTLAAWRYSRFGMIGAQVFQGGIASETLTNISGNLAFDRDLAVGILRFGFWLPRACACSLLPCQANNPCRRPRRCRCGPLTAGLAAQPGMCGSRRSANVSVRKFVITLSSGSNSFFFWAGLAHGRKRPGFPLGGEVHVDRCGAWALETFSGRPRASVPRRPRSSRQWGNR